MSLEFGSHKLVLLDPSVVEAFPLRLVLLLHPILVNLVNGKDDCFCISDCEDRGI